MKFYSEDGCARRALQVAKSEDEYPFLRDGDTTHRKYTRTFHQHRASYAPTLPGTEDPRRPGFYVVEQTVPERIGGNRVKFTITYSNVPTQRSVAGSTQFTRPSLVSLGLVSSTGTTPVAYGDSELGNAGLIVPVGTTRTYDFYLSHAVSTDTGVTNDPTGGSWTITIPGFGSTAAIPYNASASAVRSAVLAVDGSLSVSVNTPPPGYDYDFDVSISVPRPTLTKVSGSGMDAGSVYPHLFALTTPARGTATLSFVDAGLTSKPHQIPGGINYSEFKPEEITGDNMFLGAVYSYSYAPSDPRSTTRHFTGGVVTGGKIRAVIGGVETADIEVFPDNLDQTKRNINEAILAVTGGVDSHEFVTAVKIHTLGVDGYKLSENSYTYIMRTGLLLTVANETHVVISREPWYRPPTTVRHVPLPRMPAPTTYSFKAEIGGDEVTFDQDDDRASIEAGLALLPYYVAAGVSPKLATYEKGEYGIMFTVPTSSVQFSASSSLTPGPSTVYIAGTQVNLVANVADRVITTARPHGFKSGDRLYIKRGSQYEFPGVVQFTITGDNQITVQNTFAPWKDSTLITEIGQFITRYQPGPATFNTQEISSYYLPGVTQGIQTSGDIPIQGGAITEAEFVDSHFTSTSAYVTTEAGELTHYLGPILTQSYKQIKVR